MYRIHDGADRSCAHLNIGLLHTAADEDILQESFRRALSNLRAKVAKDQHDAHVDVVKDEEEEDQEEEEAFDKSYEDIITTTKAPVTRKSSTRLKNLSTRRFFGPLPNGLMNGLSKFIPAIQKMLDNLLAMCRGTPIQGFIQFIVTMFNNFFGKINQFPVTNFGDGFQGKKLAGVPTNIPPTNIPIVNNLVV
ncbi:uncharacterized protein LOC122861046 isoform X2 [Aphidius gifuensis]|uniref:uncharacterized protein LOC122861046 isoform X2 n=1 Tax=Aphidius gifuensis TaxID=684658 RepID=UPI001CDCABA2|nr:uncharacterized protein LOC122861046 isoform X2 [Aphidius gifuensis]